MNLLFAASSDFALPSLQAILASGHRLLQIYSQPDRPAGRGRHLTPTPVSQFAIEHQLPLARTPDLNAETLLSADLLIVIAFGQKIAPHIVNHPRLGSINLHASLLPRCRGAAPVNWAILGGDTITGNSIIRLADRMDAGAILGQSQLTIDPLETAGELHDRLAADGAHLLLRVLGELESGTSREQAQDESRVTHARKLTRDTARLDLSKPAEEVARWIRGLAPWPGCHVKLLDQSGKEMARLMLIRAQAVKVGPTPSSAISAPRAEQVGPTPSSAISAPRADEGVGSTSSGQITAAGHILCGPHADQPLEILELQPQGKKAMSLTAFRNGHPWEAGMRLEPV